MFPELQTTKRLPIYRQNCCRIFPMIPQLHGCLRHLFLHNSPINHLFHLLNKMYAWVLLLHLAYSSYNNFRPSFVLFLIKRFSHLSLHDTWNHIFFGSKRAEGFKQIPPVPDLYPFPHLLLFIYLKLPVISIYAKPVSYNIYPYGLPALISMYPDA